jgi:hypothetical protein
MKRKKTMTSFSTKMKNELARFGYTADKIVSQVSERFDLSETAMFLAGSVVDELSTSESDVDVLLICPSEDVGPRAMLDEGMVVDTIGLDGGRLQIAQCSVSRLTKLVESFGSLLDSSSGLLVNLSTPEKRILHRVCNGISLYNHDLSEKWREFVGKENFAKYCLVIHTYAIEAALKDALGEINGGHWLSARVQLQRATTFLGMSRLNEIGETNQNPKWVMRLALRNQEQIGLHTIETIKDGLLPGCATENEEVEVKALYGRIMAEYSRTVLLYPKLFTDKGSETDA